MMKRTLFTVLAAAALSAPALIAPALMTPAAAEVDLNVSIGVPPPPLRYEMVPAPRAGYVWAPGFWARSQPGWDWVPARWVRRGQCAVVPSRP